MAGVFAQRRPLSHETVRRLVRQGGMDQNATQEARRINEEVARATGDLVFPR